MRIKVEVRNAILGNSVFWEGDAQNISQIRNIPARMCAQLVAQDGKPRHTGMWYVSVVNGDTELVAALEAEKAARDWQPIDGTDELETLRGKNSTGN